MQEFPHFGPQGLIVERYLFVMGIQDNLLPAQFTVM